MDPRLRNMLDIDSFRKFINLDERQLETYSPLTLAYLGDCVYELVIRTTLCEKAEGSVKTHTKKATELAKAVTQAEIVHKLIGRAPGAGAVKEGEANADADADAIADCFLTEEEVAVFKRGRNAKTKHGAKSATAGQYRSATGFEALIGWLFLKGEDERILEVINEGWKRYYGR